MIRGIWTSLWINFKNMRFWILQYLMLGVVMPCSYLGISLFSAGGAGRQSVYLVGLFVSTIFSLFDHLHALNVSRCLQIEELERCIAYKTTPLSADIGGGIFHALVSLPVLIIICLVNHLASWGSVRVGITLFAWLLTSLFMNNLCFVLGGIFNKITTVQPVTSMFYMIVLMLTPFYVDLSTLSSSALTPHLFNPMAHVLSIFYWGFNLPVLCAPVWSIVYLLVLSLVCGLYGYKRWSNAKAVEKINVI